jgi:hypothetical protein
LSVGNTEASQACGLYVTADLGQAIDELVKTSEMKSMNRKDLVHEAKLRP